MSSSPEAADPDGDPKKSLSAVLRTLNGGSRLARVSIQELLVHNQDAPRSARYHLSSRMLGICEGPLYLHSGQLMLSGEAFAEPGAVTQTGRYVFLLRSSWNRWLPGIQ